eukprot:jgi/Psemu1/289828/fgenesh1_pg.410_\
MISSDISTNGESERGSHGIRSDDSSGILYIPYLSSGNDDTDDTEEQNSIQSMLKMMMTKHSSLPPLLFQGWSGDDDSTAVSAVSYDCIALDSLKNRLKAKKDRRKRDRDGDVEDAVQSIEMSDDVSFSCMSRLTTWSRVSQTTESQQHDEEIIAIRGDFDDDNDAKTTGTNSTDDTIQNSSSLSSQPGSTSSVDSKRPRRRFKCTVTVAICLAMLLLTGIIALGATLYEIRNDNGESLSMFSTDFWRVQVKNTLTFWKKEDEPGEDYLAMIDGQE